MASPIVLRRAPSLLSRLAGPARAAAAGPFVARSFNTSLQRTFDQDDDRLDVDRRSDRGLSGGRRDYAPSFFTDAFDPFTSTRSVSQLLNMMDQFMDNPFLTASRGMGSGARRGWDVREDGDALYLRMEMPGLARENVKVSVEQQTLTIKGEAAEAESEDEEGGGGRRYSSRIDLPLNVYQLDQIKAEMKNGVLKVAVPKVKEEERKDVFLVKID